MKPYRFPQDVKQSVFQVKNLLGVDFTTHESEVNSRRSPDALNMISGYQGSMDKRTGLRRLIEQKTDFSGKIYAIKKIKTFVIVPVTLERREIEVIIVHAGTKLWAYNSYLDTWQQADVWDGVNPIYTAVLQERETNLIEYSNQNNYTLIHNNWINNENELLVLYCFGRTESDHRGEITFSIILNDSYNQNIYIPTTSIGRSPNGQTSTDYERPNGLINARENLFLSNATDKTFVLDYKGNTYRYNPYVLYIYQKQANGEWGDLHLAETKTWVSHQPRSNMNNAVGLPAVESMMRAGIKVCLGNDGFSNAMWEEWKTAYLAHKLWNLDPRRMGGYDLVEMAVYNNQQLVQAQFGGTPVGVIAPGAWADLIFVDYKPFTPFTGGNAPWHILFGFNESMITTTMVAGKVLMRDRKILVLDEAAVMEEALRIAPQVWERYNQKF